MMNVVSHQVNEIGGRLHSFQYKAMSVNLKEGARVCTVKSLSRMLLYRITYRWPDGRSLRSSWDRQLAYIPLEGEGAYWQSSNRTSCSWNPELSQIWLRTKFHSQRHLSKYDASMSLTTSDYIQCLCGANSS
jgi:hypothetical protein